MNLAPGLEVGFFVDIFFLIEFFFKFGFFRTGMFSSCLPGARSALREGGALLGDDLAGLAARPSVSHDFREDTIRIIE